MVTGIPGKTGVVYTLDRATGEFLSAMQTTAQNVITNIDSSVTGFQRTYAVDADSTWRSAPAARAPPRCSPV